MFPGIFQNVSSFKGVSRKFRKTFIEIFKENLEAVSRKIEGCFEKALKRVLGCFKVISKKL